MTGRTLVSRYAAFFVIAGVVLFGLFSLAPINAGQDATKCFDTWNDRKTEAERDECLRIKPTLIAQADERQLQTAIAQATANPRRSAPSAPTHDPMEKDWYPRWDATGIKEIDMSVRDAGGPEWYRGINSLWDNGNVPNENYTWWETLKVYTKPPREGQGAVIGTGFINQTVWLNEHYSGEWAVPDELGTVKITDITGIPEIETPDVFPGPPHLIHVRGESGETAIFDLTTKRWEMQQ